MAAPSGILPRTGSLGDLKLELETLTAAVSAHSSLLITAAWTFLGLSFGYVFFKLAFPDFSSPIRNFPGPPRGNWLFGNTLETIGGSPHEAQARWLDAATGGKGGTIRVFTIFGKSYILSTDLKAIAYVFQHPDLFFKPEGPNQILVDALGKGLVTVEGTVHRRQRRVLNPAFGWVQIQEMIGVVFDTAYDMQAKLSRYVEESDTKADKAPGRRVDVLSFVSDAALDIIGKVGFGYDFGAVRDEKSDLRQVYGQVIGAAFNLTPLALLQMIMPKAAVIPSQRARMMARGRDAGQRIGREIVKERKEELRQVSAGAVTKDSFAGKDTLSLLLRANMAPDLRDDQRLSDDEVIMQISTFLFAGHETTSTALMWCLYQLTLNPRVQDKLREEVLSVDEERPSFETLFGLEYLDNVVHETLRFETPIPMNARVATRDVVVPLGEPVRGKDGKIIESVTMKKGSQFHIPIAYINRLESIWGEDAREFNPDRFSRKGIPATHVPGVWGNLLTFIGGPRNCIGHRLTVLEMKAILFVLIRTFVFEQLPSKPELKRKWLVIQRAVVKGEEDKGPQMPLLVRPYQA